MKGSAFPSTRTTNSVRLILGSQYSIGNPTLSHVQLCENYIKRARLFWELKQVLGSSMIPLRTKFDTQTTVNSHRRRKRFSSSAGLLFRSEFSDRRHNTGFGDKSRENLGQASWACYQSTLISGTSFFSQRYFPSSGRSNNWKFMRDHWRLSFPRPLAARSRVLARLASFAQIGKLARRIAVLHSPILLCLKTLLLFVSSERMV